MTDDVTVNQTVRERRAATAQALHDRFARAAQRDHKGGPSAWERMADLVLERERDARAAALAPIQALADLADSGASIDVEHASQCTSNFTDDADGCDCWVSHIRAALEQAGFTTPDAEAFRAAQANAWDRLCDWLDDHVDTDVRHRVKTAARDTNPYRAVGDGAPSPSEGQHG